ncbi:HAD hydrolase-like protein [candidate division KSB1 bacterium]|nr:HAD hydrolase-like protein [candidate division KSB1 bacterium]
MKYKLVILDFDGTLADTLPWFIQMINQIAEKYNFRKIKSDEIEALRRYDGPDFIKYLRLPMWKVPAIANHMRLSLAQDIEKVHLFDGISTMLSKLVDCGVTLAVVSSNAEQNIRYVLGEKNEKLIRHYECGVSMFGKPAKLQHVMRMFGISGQDAIYIGDEIRDIIAAKKVHIASGAVSWGYNHADALAEQNPTELFIAVDDLIVNVCGDIPTEH